VSCAKFSEVPRQLLLDAWFHCARVTLKSYNNKRRQQRTQKIIPENQFYDFHFEVFEKDSKRPILNLNI